MFMKNLSAIVKYGYIYAHHNLENVNITGSEHSVIIYLSMHTWGNQAQISQALMLNKGTIAKTLAKLEEKNIIERSINPKNKREKIVSLSEYGKSMIDIVLNISDQWEKDVLAGLTAQEKDIFYNLIEKVADNAKTIAHDQI